MDARADALSAQAKRVREYSGAAGALVLVYLLVFIGIMSQQKTPLFAGWQLLLLPFPVLFLAIPVLRVWSISLFAEAAKAQVEATRDSLDDLERELKAPRPD